MPITVQIGSETFMPIKSDVPNFELYGLPCPTSECKGVLVDHFNWKTKILYKVCSVCDGKFNHITLENMLKEADELINEILKDNDGS